MGEVIVVGGNHHNTLGVIRALGRSGIRPIVILTGNSVNSTILRSKYIKEAHCGIPNDKVVELLLTRYSHKGAKTVLIGCHDIISAIFDAEQSLLSEFFYVPGTEGHIINRLANKETMRLLAEDNGLTTPKSIEICSNESVGISSITYPCITKPAASKDGSKHDISICSDERELETFLRKRPGRKFQIQQFIEKEFEFQLIGCSINGGSEIVIPGVSKLIRPGAGSNTGFLKYDFLSDEYSDVVTKSKEFIKATGYSGLFSVEFLRGKDGNDYFMEINFRNDGNAICTTNAGANLPYWWVKKSLGDDISFPVMDHVEYVMPEFSEIGLWYSGNISTKTMITDFRQATSYMDYAADDPYPTCGWSIFAVNLLKIMFKRSLRYFVMRLQTK